MRTAIPAFPQQEMHMNRRDFLTLCAAGGGAVYLSALPGYAGAANDFYFVQLSDSHWGYQGAANPDAANTLKKAVAAVNALPSQTSSCSLVTSRIAPTIRRNAASAWPASATSCAICA
jgi:hypothetical protein